MDVRVTVREATVDDVDELQRLYRLLEAEMQALETMWNRDDALAEPVAESLRAAIEDPQHHLLLGLIDGVPVGFILGQERSMLPHTGESVGAIRLVFTEVPARGVGVGEATRNAVLDEFRSAGLTKFDAHVLPGHRMAKNFFEAAGFSARHIVMHHDDADD